MSLWLGRGTWDVGRGKWDVGSGKWEVGSGTWEVGSGTWEVESVIPLPDPRRSGRFAGLSRPRASPDTQYALTMQYAALQCIRWAFTEQGGTAKGSAKPAGTEGACSAVVTQLRPH